MNPDTWRTASPSGMVTTIPMTSAGDTRPNVLGKAPDNNVITGIEYRIDSQNPPVQFVQANAHTVATTDH